MAEERTDLQTPLLFLRKQLEDTADAKFQAV
jgi:hypothetical protein